MILCAIRVKCHRLVCFVTSFCEMLGTVDKKSLGVCSSRLKFGSNVSFTCDPKLKQANKNFVLLLNATNTVWYYFLLHDILIFKQLELSCRLLI